VKLSDSRRPQYYEFGKKFKIPAKYADTERYVWKGMNVGKKAKVLLVDKKLGVPVVRNSRSLNKPKYKTINNQLIYSDGVNPYERDKIVKAMKRFFIPFVETLDPIKDEDLPVRILVEVHRPYIGVNGQPWDVDNHFVLYQKVLQDVLQGTKDKEGKHQSKVILPEDCNLVISMPPAPLHIPVETEDDRKFVIRIYSEFDERIVNYHKRKELFTKHIKKE
jgi:hypothetical protein